MKVYITFGQGHAHSVSGKTFDKDSVAVIEAEDEGAGREKAFEYFGNKWCWSYSEDNWDAIWHKWISVFSVNSGIEDPWSVTISRPPTCG